MRNEYCLKKEKMNERKESERCPSFEALVCFFCVIYAVPNFGMNPQIMVLKRIKFRFDQSLAEIQPLNLFWVDFVIHINF